MFTQDQAIEVAKQELSRQGRSPSDYDVAIEIYFADEKQWVIWFDKKGPFPIPGGKHAVLVHKTTGQAIFLPGQ